jgi:hypothetical protein
MAILTQDGNIVNSMTVAIGVLTVVLGVHYFSGTKVHPKEPKVVRPWIPVIGHLLGMALQGGRYVKRLGFVKLHLPPCIVDLQCVLDYFTVPTPSSLCPFQVHDFTLSRNRP